MALKRMLDKEDMENVSLATVTASLRSCIGLTPSAAKFMVNGKDALTSGSISVPSSVIRASSRIVHPGEERFIVAERNDRWYSTRNRRAGAEDEGGCPDSET